MCERSERESLFSLLGVLVKKEKRETAIFSFDITFPSTSLFLRFDNRRIGTLPEKRFLLLIKMALEAASRVAAALGLLSAGALLRAGGMIGEAEVQASLIERE